MDDKTAEKTWALINRASHLLRSDAFQTGGDELGAVTASQQNVLGAVYTHPDSGLMVKDIAEQINVTRGAVSQIVESLVQLGMLERVQSKVDRRAVFVRVTPKGIAIRKKLVNKINPLLGEVLAEVNAKERAAFLKTLERLVDRIAEMTEKQKIAKKSPANPLAMEEVQ